VIAVVDFGAGNTRSVLRALDAVGAPARLVRRGSTVAEAERIVLPGVGAAGSAVVALRERELWEPLRQRAAEGTPLLGICLGAQLLLDGSDEDEAPGLGVIAGRCRAFPPAAHGGPRTVPHVGWNRVELRGGRSADAYFVHGYWLDPADPATVAATTSVDGFGFPSLLRTGNVIGTQFHPEKSGAFGRALLAAFASGALDAANARAADPAQVTAVGTWT
jgi:imidazole glycerol-phosphate synthase subunit HisH